MKRSLFLLLAVATSTLSFAQVSVTLYMDQKLGDQPFDYNLAVQSEMGYMFNVTRLQYYVSEIKLIHDGGQVTPVSDLYLLVDPEKRNEFELGSFNITDFEQIQFSVGVDSAHNHLDPATYPAGHPLAHQNPSMHWGWFSGYRFIAMEGFAGPSADSLSFGYQIHTIADANYRTVTLDAVEVLNGDNMDAHIEADYMQMLKDIDASEGLIFHGANGAAKKLTDNTRDYVFTPGEVTAIQDLKSLGSIQISPNPAVGFTTLNYDMAGKENLVLAITDVTGQILLKRELETSQGHVFLETNFQPGIYVANIYSGKQLAAVQKLVVR